MQWKAAARYAAILLVCAYELSVCTRYLRKHARVTPEQCNPVLALVGLQTCVEAPDSTVSVDGVQPSSKDAAMEIPERISMSLNLATADYSDDLPFHRHGVFDSHNSSLPQPPQRGPSLADDAANPPEEPTPAASIDVSTYMRISVEEANAAALAALAALEAERMAALDAYKSGAWPAAADIAEAAMWAAPQQTLEPQQQNIEEAQQPIEEPSASAPAAEVVEAVAEEVQQAPEVVVADAAVDAAEIEAVPAAIAAPIDEDVSAVFKEVPAPTADAAAMEEAPAVIEEAPAAITVETPVSSDWVPEAVPIEPAMLHQAEEAEAAVEAAEHAALLHIPMATPSPVDAPLPIDQQQHQHDQHTEDNTYFVAAVFAITCLAAIVPYVLLGVGGGELVIQPEVGHRYYTYLEDRPHANDFLVNWTPGHLDDAEGHVVPSSPLARAPPRAHSPSDDVAGEGDQQGAPPPTSPTASLTGSLLAAAGKMVTSAAKTAGAAAQKLASTGSRRTASRLGATPTAAQRRGGARVAQAIMEEEVEGPEGEVNGPPAAAAGLPARTPRTAARSMRTAAARSQAEAPDAPPSVRSTRSRARVVA